MGCLPQKGGANGVEFHALCGIHGGYGVYDYLWCNGCYF